MPARTYTDRVTADSPAPSPRSRLVPTPALVWAIVCGVLMLASIWWGVTREAFEHAHVLTGGDATMQAGLAFGVFAVGVPILFAIVSSAAMAGLVAIDAALRDPEARFASRFGRGFVRLMALVAGELLLGCVGAIAAIAITALGVPHLDVLASVQRIALTAVLVAGLAVAAGVTGLAIASLTSGVAVRPLPRS